MGPYADAYAESLSAPERFWLFAAEAIDWSRKPDRALDGPSPTAATNPSLPLSRTPAFSTHSGPHSVTVS